MSTNTVPVETIISASRDLNQATDRATQIVAEAEAILNKCSIGIPVEVPLVQPHAYSKLAYCRLIDKFRICFIGKLAEGDVRPFSELSREDKIFGIRHLPDLLLTIAVVLKDKLAWANESLGAAARGVERLRVDMGGQPDGQFIPRLVATRLKARIHEATNINGSFIPHALQTALRDRILVEIDRLTGDGPMLHTTPFPLSMQPLGQTDAVETKQS